MASLPMVTWIRFFAWMAVGLAIYFGYSRFHSHVDATASANAAADGVAGKEKRAREISLPGPLFCLVAEAIS
jgi:hypothetical protein